MKRDIGYTADDGTRFATTEECKAHERDIKVGLLINRTGDDILSAIARQSSYIELADAIEFAGNLIAAKRRADGGAKRKRKTIAERHTEAAAARAGKNLVDGGGKVAKVHGRKP